MIDLICSSLLSDISFFVHFVFESPHIIIQSYKQSSIKRVEIIPFSLSSLTTSIEGNNHFTEDQIIELIFNSGLLFSNQSTLGHSSSSSSSVVVAAISSLLQGILSSLPDLLLSGVSRFDFSDYVIEKKIGKGGFGTIWLAASSSSSSLSSLKVVLKELNDWSIKKYKEFVSEVLMMNEFKSSKYILRLIGIASPPSPSPPLHHPCNDDQEIENIIIVNNDHHYQQQDNGSDDQIKENTLLMVIEYASFGDLASLLQRSKEDAELRSKLTIKLKLRIALNIASALSDLHSSHYRLIHRDVRSQNIFIFSLHDNDDDNDEEERINAKLGDLGCMVVGNPSYSSDIGNYQYAAPEAMSGSLTVPYSQMIDVYSFGIVFWELFSENPPFNGLMIANNQNTHHCQTLKTKIISGLRPSLDDILIENAREMVNYSAGHLLSLKESVSLLLNQCWHHNPQSRPTFQQIKLSISQLVQNLSSFSSSPPSTNNHET